MILTVVNVRYSSLKEYQSRKRVDTIFLRFFQVADFHESYVVLVTIVVDVLQLAQHLLALFLILVICSMTTELLVRIIKSNVVYSRETHLHDYANEFLSRRRARHREETRKVVLLTEEDGYVRHLLDY